jgi:hypothetical protein
MNNAEAMETFKDLIVNECPNCKAPVGELCVENRGVWIHIERFQLVWDAEKRAALYPETPPTNAGYRITLDFGDNAVQVARTFTTLPLLCGYLEQIPGMMGFEVNGGVKIDIRIVNNPERHNHP